MPPRLAGGREAVFVTTGHPGTTDPAAFTRFDLAAGETRRNVDITLATAPRVRVRGIALGPNGPLGQVTVRLQRQHGGLGGEDGVRATGHADGHFEFLSVPPGSYELNAYRVLGESDVVLPDPDGYWARMPFTIGEQDVDDLTVRLMPGVTVRARIEMDGVAAAEVFPISLVSTGTFRLGAGTRARPAPGTFEVTGVAPGEYLWSTGGRREGTLVSIERGGLDITGEPLIVGTTDIDDVLISTTSRPALVRGTVSPPAGTPVELLSAVLLPVDPRRRGTVWNQTTLVRSVDLPPEGTFAFERLPPGRYAVAAVDEATMAGWPAPDLLDRLAASADVITIGVGQTLVHDLVVRR
jgi:hypothetical protein